MTRPGAARARLFAVALVVVGLGACGCERDHDEDAGAAAPAASPAAAAEGVLHVSRRAQARAGIIVAAVGEAKAQPLQASGFASVLDPARLAQVSAAWVGASAQVQAATSKAAVSRQAFERARLLYQDDRNVSLAELQTAEAAWRADEAALTAARAQSLAARTAAVAAFGPALGSRGADDRLIRSLVERRTFLVQVTAPPGRPVAPSAVAMLKTPGGQAVRARLLGPAPQVDPRLQAMGYYYVAPAGAGLAPGMNLSVLEATAQTRPAVEVPGSAVVSWNGESWAYQRTGPESFRRVALVGAQPLPGGGVLTDALAPGAVVVVRGAELLLSHELQPQAESGEGDED